MRFKIDLVSYPTVFALFHFVFVGNFKVEAPQGLIYSDDDLTEGFLCYEFWEGAYIWRSIYMERLISEFYGIEYINDFNRRDILFKISNAAQCRIWKRHGRK